MESPDPVWILEIEVIQSQEIELLSKWVVRLETIAFGLKSKNKKQGTALK